MVIFVLVCFGFECCRQCDLSTLFCWRVGIIRKILFIFAFGWVLCFVLGFYCFVLSGFVGLGFLVACLDGGVLLL